MNPTKDPNSKAVIELRTTLGRKGRYKQAAYPEPMAKWMIDTLDEAAKRKLNLKEI